MVSGASSVSGENLSGLYNYFGFKDKNGNGVIEEKGLRTLWRDEGYEPYFDLNGDGKLVAAEIRYGLHYLNVIPINNLDTQDIEVVIDENDKLYVANINKDSKVVVDIEALKRENPFTEEDRKIILGIYRDSLKKAERFKSPYDRALSIAYNAFKMAELRADGSEIEKAFKEALKATQRIKEADQKIKALDNIINTVDKVVRKDWFDGYKASLIIYAASDIFQKIDYFDKLSTSLRIDIPFYSAEFHLKNASLMNNWKFYRGGLSMINAELMNATSKALDIEDPFTRAIKLRDIALAISGVAIYESPNDVSTEVLQLALDAGSECQPAEMKVDSFRWTASAFSKIGNKTVAENILREALDLAVNAGSALHVYSVAAMMEQICMDEDEVFSAYQLALQTAKGPLERYDFLVKLSKDDIGIDLKYEEIKTILRDAFKTILNSKDLIGYYKLQPFRLIDIAEMMGRGGMDKQEVIDAFKIALPVFMREVKVEAGEKYCLAKEAEQILNAMYRAGLNDEEMKELLEESKSGICLEDYLHIFCRQNIGFEL